MSEDTTTRARPYPAALKDEISDLNNKMDMLIKHWADAAEMTAIMEECRATVTEAHKVNHQDLTRVSQQLNLLLTPITEEPPPRWRLALWSGVVLVAVLVSFWLGGMAPWVRSEPVRRLEAQAQRLEGFLRGPAYGADAAPSRVTEGRPGAAPGDLPRA